MPTIPVSLNLPARKSKSFTLHFGLQTVPFYTVNVAAPEGCPMKLADEADVMEPVTPGACGAGVCVGFLANQVYDPAPLGELSNYDFVNSTKTPIGRPQGLVTGQGYALTTNYAGAVAYGDKLYPAPSGKLSASRTGSDAAVAVSEGEGTNGDTLIRIRIDLAIA